MSPPPDGPRNWPNAPKPAFALAVLAADAAFGAGVGALAACAGGAAAAPRLRTQDILNPSKPPGPCAAVPANFLPSSFDAFANCCCRLAHSSAARFFAISYCASIRP